MFLCRTLNSGYNTEDCHGPSGLAMINRGGFPAGLVEKTKPMLKWAK
jgi:hypothetical protein